jgi:hypothetical protein
MLILTEPQLYMLERAVKTPVFCISIPAYDELVTAGLLTHGPIANSQFDHFTITNLGKAYLAWHTDDLNLCHAVWTTLSYSEHETFEHCLYTEVVGNAEYHGNDDRPYITNATAKQRANVLIQILEAK